MLISVLKLCCASEDKCLGVVWCKCCSVALCSIHFPGKAGSKRCLEAERGGSPAAAAAAAAATGAASTVAASTASWVLAAAAATTAAGQLLLV